MDADCPFHTFGLDPVSAPPSVAATLGPIGPGLGAVGPMSSYVLIPESGKHVLNLNDAARAPGAFAVIAVLTPAFWRR